MKTLRDEIDMEKLPVHIAIIMDGNGRWQRKDFFLENLAIKQELTH